MQTSSHLTSSPTNCHLSSKFPNKKNDRQAHIHIKREIMSLTNDSPEVAAAAAKTASFTLASLPASARNEALEAIHAALTAFKDEILAANARDLELAQKAAADGRLSQALVSRLDLGKKGKWEDMLQGILDVRDLDDPGTWLAFDAFIFQHLIFPV